MVLEAKVHGQTTPLFWAPVEQKHHVVECGREKLLSSGQPESRDRQRQTETYRDRNRARN